MVLIKRGIILLVFSLMFFSGINALSGVYPASYEINFQPGLKQNFEFNFVFDAGSRAEIYASGDFADNVKLNNQKISGSEQVIATLELPAEAKKPGRNILRIGAREQSGEGGVSLVADVGGIIFINVPYPGKYVDAELEVTDANAGEPVKFKLSVHNKGKEDVYLSPVLKIMDADKEIDIINLGTADFLKTTESKEYSGTFNTTGLGSGDYNATAIISYGAQNVFETSNGFRLGHLFVDVTNTTKEVNKDKINRMEIEVASFWNDPIEGVYAEVEIPANNQTFRTPSIDLKPWEKTRLTGFFDSTGLGSKFQARVKLNYANITTEKTFELRVKQEIDYFRYGVFGALIVIILLMAVIVILLLRNGKRKK